MPRFVISQTICEGPSTSFKIPIPYTEDRDTEVTLENVLIPHTFYSVGNSSFTFQEKDQIEVEVFISEGNYSLQELAVLLEELLNSSSPTQSFYKVDYGTDKRFTIHSSTLFNIFPLTISKFDCIKRKLGFKRNYNRPIEYCHHFTGSPIFSFYEEALLLSCLYVTFDTFDFWNKYPKVTQNYYIIPVNTPYGSSNICSDIENKMKGVLPPISQGSSNYLEIELERGDGNSLNLHGGKIELEFSYKYVHRKKLPQNTNIIICGIL